MMVEVKKNIVYLLPSVLVANAIFYSSGGKNRGKVNIPQEWNLEKTVERNYVKRECLFFRPTSVNSLLTYAGGTSKFTPLATSTH